MDDLELMQDVVESFGLKAYGKESELEATAREWLDAGFSSDEAGGWLEVDCWEPSVARQFVEAGLESEDLMIETYLPTRSMLADKASTGVINVEAAIRIAKSQR